MTAHHEAIDHRVPSFHSTVAWELVFETPVADGLDGGGRQYKPGETYAAAPRSFALLVRRNSERPGE